MASFEKILARKITLELNGVRRIMTLREAIEHKIVEGGARLPPLQMLKLLTLVDEVIRKENDNRDYIDDDRLVAMVRTFENLSILIDALVALEMVEEEGGLLKFRSGTLYAFAGAGADTSHDPRVQKIWKGYVVQRDIEEREREAREEG